MRAVTALWRPFVRSPILRRASTKRSVFWYTHSRSLTGVPSSSDVDREYLEHFPGSDTDIYRPKVPEDDSGNMPVDTDIVVPIIAYNVGRAIDYMKTATMFASSGKMPPRYFFKNGLVLHFPHLQLNDPSHPRTMPKVKPHKYMVVFGYGSLVFFDFEKEEVAACIRQMSKWIERYYKRRGGEEDGCIDIDVDGSVVPITGDNSEQDASKERQIRVVPEYYSVVIRPDMKEWAEVHSQMVRMRYLDIHNLRLVSNTLGQTVALGAYEQDVDNMLNDFRRVNINVANKGNMGTSNAEIHQVLAENSAILTEIMMNLGLLDRSDTGWMHAKYSMVHESLHEEFELANRFHNIEKKMMLIGDNTKFVLEFLHNQKSNKLEMIIILLISVEIMLGVYELTSKRKE